MGLLTSIRSLPPPCEISHHVHYSALGAKYRTQYEIASTFLAALSSWRHGFESRWGCKSFLLTRVAAASRAQVPTPPVVRYGASRSGRMPGRHRLSEVR